MLMMLKPEFELCIKRWNLSNKTLRSQSRGKSFASKKLEEIHCEKQELLPSKNEKLSTDLMKFQKSRRRSLDKTSPAIGSGARI